MVLPRLALAGLSAWAAVAACRGTSPADGDVSSTDPELGGAECSGGQTAGDGCLGEAPDSARPGSEDFEVTRLDAGAFGKPSCLEDTGEIVFARWEESPRRGERGLGSSQDITGPVVRMAPDSGTEVVLGDFCLSATDPREPARAVGSGHVAVRTECLFEGGLLFGHRASVFAAGSPGEAGLVFGDLPKGTWVGSWGPDFGCAEVLADGAPSHVSCRRLDPPHDEVLSLPGADIRLLRGAWAVFRLPDQEFVVSASAGETGHVYEGDLLDVEEAAAEGALYVSVSATGGPIAIGRIGSEGSGDIETVVNEASSSAPAGDFQVSDDGSWIATLGWEGTLRTLRVHDLRTGGVTTAAIDVRTAYLHESGDGSAPVVEVSRPAGEGGLEVFVVDPVSQEEVLLGRCSSWSASPAMVPWSFAAGGALWFVRDADSGREIVRWLRGTAAPEGVLPVASELVFAGRSSLEDVVLVRALRPSESPIASIDEGEWDVTWIDAFTAEERAVLSRAGLGVTSCGGCNIATAVPIEGGSLAAADLVRVCPSK